MFVPDGPAFVAERKFVRFIWPWFVERIAFKHSQTPIFHEEFKARSMLETIEIGDNVAKPERRPARKFLRPAADGEIGPEADPGQFPARDLKRAKLLAQDPKRFGLSRRQLFENRPLQFRQSVPSPLIVETVAAPKGQP